MRRKEKEITDQSLLQEIIKKAVFCRLGVIDDNKPYILPLCFGYRDGAIFIHSALKGKKLNAIQKNPNVCLQFDINTEIVQADEACKWGVKYQSVIAYGRAEILDSPPEKAMALGIITQHYSDHSIEFEPKRVNQTAVIKIEIENMTGKQSGM